MERRDEFVINDRSSRLPDGGPQSNNADSDPPEFALLGSNLETNDLRSFLSDQIQDVYPLTSLQEGLLFHHLLDTSAGAYILSNFLEIESAQALVEFKEAIQQVINRHEILRSAIVWESVSRPVHVVYRHAQLHIEELSPDHELHPAEQLQRFARSKARPWDLQRAPLLALYVVRGAAAVHALLQIHHLICDYGSLRMVIGEIAACMRGKSHELAPVRSYRQQVESALTKSQNTDAHGFFTSKYGDVEETTAPFGVVHLTSGIQELRKSLDPDLSQRVRIQALRLKIGTARLLHAAWALVVARTSGRSDVVFGTVLLAKEQREARENRIIGISINTLPLRIKLSADLTALGLVMQTKRELDELLGFEGASLALAQKCSSVGGASPLFSSLFNFRHSDAGGSQGWENVPGVTLIDAPEARTNYPIVLTVDDTGDGFTFTAQTDTQIDPGRVIEYLRTAVDSLVSALETSPESSVFAVNVVPYAESLQISQDFNATYAAYPGDQLVHQLFEQQVTRTPDAKALLHGKKWLTYAELNVRSSQLARYLKHLGVGPDKLVGLCLERGFTAVISLLAILKAGGAYVPLDPTYPIERLTQMLEDSAPSIILTSRDLIDHLPQTSATFVTPDSKLKEIRGSSQENLDPAQLRLDSGHLVYVIYTSGSTGRPKGTAMTHNSMVNLIDWHRRAFPESSFKRTLQFASLSFDVAFQEIFSSLCTGGCLVLLDEWARRDTATLWELIDSAEIHRLFLPPLMLQALAESSRQVLPGGLEDIIVAGEQLRITRQIASLFERLAGCRLHNHYGPTETHVVTALTLAGEPATWPARPSIGRPISNCQIYILDTALRQVPIGVTGEIYIGGANVAKAYLRRPELSAERFLSDPFAPVPNKRMYRTGDLGRWRNDGTIEYLGRNDQQVKIRGFRVELEEIATSLQGHAQIRDAAVLLREDIPGDKRLVAYFTARNGQAPKVESLRTHLRATLPEHMVPSAFVALEEMPLTASGKLNRRALPTPQLEAYMHGKYEPPAGDLECTIARVWRELLGIAQVGRKDNFFALGGHSLLIVHMLERLRRASIRTGVRTIYDSESLEDLANAIAAQTAAAGNPGPEPEQLAQSPAKFVPDPADFQRIIRSIAGGSDNIEDIYPLAPLQEGMLAHHRLGQDGPDSYVLPILLRVSSRAALAQLISALESVINRHEALRTGIYWEHLTRPLQVVMRKVALPVTQIRLDPGRDPGDQLRERMQPEHQRLQLSRAPLIRMQITDCDLNGCCYALIQIHHLICDNGSLDTMFRELLAFMQGRGNELPTPMAYRSHVLEVLANEDSNSAKAFFRQKLGDVAEPTLAFGVEDLHGGAGAIERSRVEIGSPLAQQIRAQARRLNVSTATLFHAAWALLVARTANRDDVVFGTVLLGRMHSSASPQSTLGLFINTLPLRLRLRDVSAVELVRQTQRELAELLAHENSPLAIAQGCSRVTGSTPLFNSLLNYRHKAVDLSSEIAGAAGLKLLEMRSWTNFPILMSVDEIGEGFALIADTDHRIESEHLIACMEQTIRSLVRTLDDEPDAMGLSLVVLPDSEVQRARENYRSASIELPSERTVHRLYEKQVRSTPQVTALVHAEQRLSYAELNGAANQLARHLISRGVGPGEVVGICMERGPAMVLGLLGILKAGAAYVPLDPNYPADRLQYMIEDAHPRAVVTEQALTSLFAGSTADILVLDESLSAIAGQAREDLSEAESAAGEQDLVYVIYTSGSTGRPKGTAMAHRSMVNLIEWHRKELPTQEGQRVLQFAALSFDVAFQEIFSTLCSGATLVLLNEWVRRDTRALAQLLDTERIERLFVPPLMLQSLAEHSMAAGTAPQALRDVITAGEQLRVSPQIVSFFKRLGAGQLHNHYGPTESHVVTALTLSGDPAQWPALPTIGRPIANAQIYILDEQRQLLPRGVSGEIYIGGTAVARGYRGRAELTAQRFIKDPFSTDPGARLYKTGDLGRWRVDGTLEYLGRNDYQVKIRGYRIELGEIETQLARHPLVKDAVVTVREDGAQQKRLVAHVTLRTATRPSAEELRTHLKSGLPEHMVPAAFVILDHLPLTPSGKLDRNALPAPQSTDYATQDFQPPQGELEHALAQIWQELLGVERIGRHDNFFDLGGHSLLATRVISHISHDIGVELPLKAIFDEPTVERLSDYLAERVLAQVPTEAA